MEKPVETISKDWGTGLNATLKTLESIRLDNSGSKAMKMLIHRLHRETKICVICG
jgi:hypothetical protein